MLLRDIYVIYILNDIRIYPYVGEIVVMKSRMT